jgi:holin-like protein
MKIITQVAIIFGICLLGEWISVILPFAFPGTVISMILLFALLLSRLIKVDKIRPTAEFLMKNMAFFLIPPGVGILSSLDILKKNMIPFLIIVIVSTILTFASAAWTVQAVIRLQKRLNSSDQGGKKS